MCRNARTCVRRYTLSVSVASGSSNRNERLRVHRTYKAKTDRGPRRDVRSVGLHESLHLWNINLLHFRSSCNVFKFCIGF